MVPDLEGSVEATAIRRSVKCCSECAQQYSADSMFCPFDGTKLEPAEWVAPTDPSVDPRLGTIVDGRYRIVRALGEGGTATVYEVVHQTLSRAFAMKVLRRDVAADPSLAARFIQEAKATASLKHPRIVSITDFGHLADKTPYFVMERLVGQTLAHVCKVGGQLPMDRAVHIVLEVASAIAVAHEAGIVHRDLKPENIFLVGRVDGGGPGGDDVRVVDFGAAKIAGASRITKTGIVFGTPHYMSPEQASGQPVDHRADIYALGVVMYELFSGHLPFEADTQMGVLTKHMFVEPAPFATADGSSPDTATLLGALEAVTLRAMAKKPEHRFQTMAALAAELERTVSIGESGDVSLAPGWSPAPRRRASRPLGELSRALEGPDRANVYPSGELPVLPTTSWRGPAIGVVALVGTVLIGSAALGRRNTPAQAVDVVGATSSSAEPPTLPTPAAPSASTASANARTPASSPSSPSSPSSMPATVHLTTTPSFAEVWQDGRRIGTTPTDLPVDPTRPPVRCTLRAPGYAERAVLVDPSSPTLDVKLERVAHSAPRKAPASAPTATRQRASSDGELVDPFSR